MPAARSASQLRWPSRWRTHRPAPRRARYGARPVQGLVHRGLSRDLLDRALHFPVLSLRGSVERRGWRYAGDAQDRAGLEDHLHDHDGPVLVLAGHLHVGGHAIDRNVLQLSQAALVETPHDAAVVTVTAGADQIDVTRNCHPIAQAGGDRPPVLDPASVGFRWDGTGWAQTTPAEGHDP